MLLRRYYDSRFKPQAPPVEKPAPAPAPADEKKPKGGKNKQADKE